MVRLRINSQAVLVLILVTEMGSAAHSRMLPTTSEHSSVSQHLRHRGHKVVCITTIKTFLSRNINGTAGQHKIHIQHLMILAVMTTILSTIQEQGHIIMSPISHKISTTPRTGSGPGICCSHICSQVLDGFLATFGTFLTLLSIMDGYSAIWSMAPVYGCSQTD